MGSITKSMNKILIIAALMIILASCGEKGAIKEETLYFKDENREWLLLDSVNLPFVMIDDNGIAQSFSYNTSSCYFNKSWSSFLGINTHMTHTEYCYTSCRSTYGTGYSQSLTAGSYPERGDVVHVSVDEINFSYDLEVGTVFTLYTPFGSKSKIITDEGYLEDEPFLSTVEMIGSLSVNGYDYTDVLHFSLKDFQDQWKKYTLVEIFIGKGHGLIRYVTSSGLASNRISN
jgi:hypothetical protein